MVLVQIIKKLDATILVLTDDFLTIRLDLSFLSLVVHGYEGDLRSENWRR